MMEFVTSRRGAYWLKFNNYLYSINNATDNDCVRYYECIRRAQCYARIVVKRSSSNSDDWAPTQTVHDNHYDHETEEAEFVKIKFTALCEKKIKAAPSTITTLVYRDALAEMSLTEPADMISLIEPYQAYRHHLQKWKKRLGGHIPKEPRRVRRPSTKKPKPTSSSATSTASADTTTTSCTTPRQPRATTVRYIEGAIARLDAFEVTVNVDGYSPQELTVKVVDGFVTVSGKHEVKLDDSIATNQFSRSYRVPAGAHLPSAKSTLCPGGKALRVVVPLTVAETNEFTIPIEVSPEVNIPSNTVDRYILNLFN
ncbi:Heat shock protein beta-1 [Halotydeus destructor]|nr:Heat shock protein beta-1 [Halotydeus destructor]